MQYRSHTLWTNSYTTEAIISIILFLHCLSLEHLFCPQEWIVQTQASLVDPAMICKGIIF